MFKVEKAPRWGGRHEGTGHPGVSFRENQRCFTGFTSLEFSHTPEKSESRVRVSGDVHTLGQSSGHVMDMWWTCDGFLTCWHLMLSSAIGCREQHWANQSSALGGVRYWLLVIGYWFWSFYLMDVGLKSLVPNLFWFVTLLLCLFLFFLFLLLLFCWNICWKNTQFSKSTQRYSLHFSHFLSMWQKQRQFLIVLFFFIKSVYLQFCP